MKQEDIKFETRGALFPFMKRLFAYSLRFPKWLSLFIISTVLVGIIDAIFPYIWMRYLDDVVIPGVAAGTATDLSGIVRFGWIFGGFGLLSIVMVFTFIFFAGKIQEHVLYILRQEMFEKLQKLSFSYFDRSQMGWLVSRITSDTDRVCELISWGLLECMWGLTMIFFCIGAMFLYSWKLALIVALSIPLLIVASFKIRMLILKYSRASRKINSEMTANFTEHINGVETNKVTAQEERMSGEFSKISGKMQAVTYRSTYYTAMYMPVVIFIGSLAAAVVIYVGGQLSLSVVDGITIGGLAASFAYATRIFLPIMDISRFYALAQGSLSAGERIFSLIDETIEIKDAPQADSEMEIQGEVIFKDVDFHYHPDKPVLEKLNLHVEAGTSIALVGPTGEGKSTIVNLIGRFYELKGGRITIDGKDHTQIKKCHLRKQLGVVLQSPHLFEGTLKDNVKYARPNATDEQVVDALKLVGADSLLSRMDDGVGESGDQLSMGERQLVSFARAILADPRIFIMDEATSSIDAVAEAKIQQGIEQLIKGRTSFIIAHRLSTIRNCDRILVISKGHIIEDGSHQELMRQQGKYYQLYTRQVRAVEG